MGKNDKENMLKVRRHTDKSKHSVMVPFSSEDLGDAVSNIHSAMEAV